LIELPDLATFAATLADRRFIAAACVAVLAGTLRGFSGFGSALIYVPLIAAVYEPRIATVSLILIDQICVAPYAIAAFRQCSWREILPAFIAAAFTVPLGTLVQRYSDPVMLRWGMAIFVITFVAIFASGWRYRWKPNAAAAVGAGALSGFAGGATQMSGPPVILYWLGSPNAAVIVRANLLVYLLLLGLTLIVNYCAQGMLTALPIALAVMLWPAYSLSVWIGARWFRGTSDAFYRKVAYMIVAVSALISLPLFDGWIR
jgi:uncharacterized membrane protein YfcA